MIKAMFFFISLTGVIITISAHSWFTVWLGLEINMMAFLPIMIDHQNQHSYESCLKYFFSQTLASSFLLLALIIPPQAILWPFSLTTPTSTTIISMALILKLGAAPFHFWFPPTMEGLNWTACMVLATVQKISPLILLTLSSSNILMLSVFLSAGVGAIGGYNQLLLRKLMAYSSIGHLSWMIMSTLLSQTILIFYLMTYMYLSLLMMMTFLLMNYVHLSQTISQPQTTPLMLTMMNMLSLGGLPPFLGFVPKWIIVQEMMNMKMIFLVLVMIMCSLITLYYYLRVAYSAFLKTLPLHMSESLYSNKIMLMASAPSLASLPLILPLMM